MITCHLRYVLDPTKLQAFEHYGRLCKSFNDPACQAAFKYAEETRCFLSYERTFFRPVFE